MDTAAQDIAIIDNPWAASARNEVMYVYCMAIEKNENILWTCQLDNVKYRDMVVRR